MRYEGENVLIIDVRGEARPAYLEKGLEMISNYKDWSDFDKRILQSLLMEPDKREDIITRALAHP